MNEEVSKYITEAPDEQRKLMEEIRAIIHRQVAGVEEQYKWSRPVFSAGSDFAYFKTSKKHLTFGVFHFDKINDHTELLEGTGKDMRHIKLKSPDDLQPDVIRQWLHQITT